jgi:hypothetical protein
MANRVNIFISASSSDLRTFRKQVRDWLLDMNWHPVVQDHFETHDDKTVIQMLRQEIKKSDAISSANITARSRNRLRRVDRARAIRSLKPTWR